MFLSSVNLSWASIQSQNIEMRGFKRWEKQEWGEEEHMTWLKGLKKRGK